MKVFVAGATGVIGRTLLPQLLADGHTVIGLARTPEGMLAVKKSGAEPVRGDVLDRDAMRTHLAEVKPDAVVNLATQIPLKLRVNPDDWKMNDRIRVEGSANLLDACASSDIRLFVQESVGYVCKSLDDRWIDEEAPLSNHPFLAATINMERQVRASTVPTTILRLAALTSADSWHTQQTVAALQRGFLPIIGDGAAYLSLIHSDDAASAIVRVLDAPERSAGQTFNVVDDEPAPMKDVFPYIAARISAPAPKHVPAFIAKLAVGNVTMDVLTASYRMSNSKIRRTLGFAPRYPTYRDSWAQVTRQISGTEIRLTDDLM